MVKKIISLSFVHYFPLFLIILSFISFIYINDNFNYNINFVIIQDLTIFIFVLFAFSKYLLVSKEFDFKLSKLKTSVLILLIFVIISGIVGYKNGNNIGLIFYESYNLLYYVLLIPFVFIIDDGEKYRKIFIILLILCLIVAAQYIYINAISSSRFTSFHAGFFPIIISCLFSYILFLKSKKKKHYILILLLIIFIIATYSTLTRSLWISVLFSLCFVFLYYYKVSKIKILIAALLIILIFSLQGDSSNSNIINKPSGTTKERVESLSNPQSDASFLMRLELGYYAVQKFFENPVLGTGLGDVISYKIFGKAQINYLDNSWLYFLWKGGLVGFIIFLLLYIRFFKECFYIIRNTNDIVTKTYCIGIVGGFIGFLVFSLFSANLIKYSKTNLFYAFIFAYIEIESSKLKISNNKY